VILVDTSVWIDFLRRGGPLARLLENNEVLVHPFVIGELACGNLRNRQEVLGYMHKLPTATTASDQEVLYFVEEHELAGRGVGYLEMHLLASVQMHPHAMLWTKDRKLAALASELSLSH
jgi:predicted nucleic acid-binding protein